MNWQEIEKFVNDSGGRALVIVDGNPSLVVMNYKDYQSYQGHGNAFQQLATLPEEPEPKPEKKSLVIEDLPL
jgi:hypothetical protein